MRPLPPMHYPDLISALTEHSPLLHYMLKLHSSPLPFLVLQKPRDVLSDITSPKQKPELHASCEAQGKSSHLFYYAVASFVHPA